MQRISKRFANHDMGASLGSDIHMEGGYTGVGQPGGFGGLLEVLYSWSSKYRKECSPEVLKLKACEHHAEAFDPRLLVMLSHRKVVSRGKNTEADQAQGQSVFQCHGI